MMRLRAAVRLRARPAAAASSASLADALVVIAEAFLAGKVAGADDPEVYQVVLHLGTGAITPDSAPAGQAGQAGDVSAETPAASARPPGHPATRPAVTSRTGRRSA